MTIRAAVRRARSPRLVESSAPRRRPPAWMLGALCEPHMSRGAAEQLCQRRLGIAPGASTSRARAVRRRPARSGCRLRGRDRSSIGSTRWTDRTALLSGVSASVESHALASWIPCISLSSRGCPAVGAASRRGAAARRGVSSDARGATRMRPRDDRCGARRSCVGEYFGCTRGGRGSAWTRAGICSARCTASSAHLGATLFPRLAIAAVLSGRTSCLRLGVMTSCLPTQRRPACERIGSAVGLWRWHQSLAGRRPSSAHAFDRLVASSGRRSACSDMRRSRILAAIEGVFGFGSTTSCVRLPC